MTSLHPERDDARALCRIDTGHSFLATAPDRWFDATGYHVLSERASDGAALVVAILDYPRYCPIDTGADVMIRYWLANLHRKAELRGAFLRSVIRINGKMEQLGATDVWGLVSKTAYHLTSFLDDVAAAGACRKIDGAGVQGESDYQHFYLYVGGRDAVTDFMSRRG